MRIGVVFPQIEIGTDLAVLRDYAQTAEGVGYKHLLAYDHVVGADTSVRPGWRGSYSSESLFHEPFVFFGYLAGITTNLELVTGVIILPQRQTVLVAKQAAEVDILTNGRFRLGVGVGWNQVEFEALNEDFSNRGKREEEQIEVMRLLWTNETIDYQGKWHRIPAAGIKPLPVQRPIPVWLGGSSEPAYKRIGRLADGWMPQFRPTAEGAETIERVRSYTREAGRDPGSLGMEGRMSLGQIPREEWRQELQTWKDLGATHVAINTMGMKLAKPRDHIAMIQKFYEEVGAAEFNTD